MDMAHSPVQSTVSNSQVVVEIYVRTGKTVWRHTRVCRHMIFRVITKIATTAWSWELCFAQVPAQGEGL